jgi:hypothetical protein
MQQQLVNDKSIAYDYDSYQDMLYILFEPITGATFYEDVPNMPGVMRRFTLDDERLVGITVHAVQDRLAANHSQDKALRQLTQTLVEQLNN